MSWCRTLCEHVLLFLPYHYHQTLIMSSANPHLRRSTRVRARLEGDASRVVANNGDAPPLDIPPSSTGAVAPRKRKKSTTPRRPASQKAAARNAMSASSTGSLAEGESVLSSQSAGGSSGLQSSARDDMSTTELVAGGGGNASQTSQQDDSALMSPRPNDLRRVALNNWRATTPMTLGSETVPVTPPPKTWTTSDAHELNNQVDSTPHGHSARNGVLESDRAPEVEEQLLKELGEIATTTIEFLLSLYDNVATLQEIDAFLDSPDCPFKRKVLGSPEGHWIGIPQPPKRENKIYTPLMNVFQSIVTHFDNGDSDEFGPGVVRDIVDTHDTSLENENKTKSRPDYVVRAEGPSFEIPSTTSQRMDGHETLGYTNAASVFEVKTEKSRGSVIQQVGQLARYCQ